MVSSVMLNAERTRVSAVSSTTDTIRSNFSQYLTPYQTASLAASMFSNVSSSSSLRCLDLGSGTGILSVALAERYGNQVAIDDVELDPLLANICDSELTRLNISHKVHVGNALLFDNGQIYDRIILNPPYRKMAANDPLQVSLPVRSPNLYSAFLMVAARSLSPNGECVAIIPRSWMNGQYFQAFREWLLSFCSIDSMHIYGSRTEIFADTNVLQETMILAFSRRKQGEFIMVSESLEKDANTDSHRYRFDSLVDVSGDASIRVEPDKLSFLDDLATLRQIGLCASTGKVVDFRSRDVIHDSYKQGLNRLIYSSNFFDGRYVHPVSSGKPQWIDCSSEKFAHQLIPAGNYAVVKRFSSKEEARRIKAFVLHLDVPEALENHLNFVHAGTPRKVISLEEGESLGLVLWLSSTEIENWFRARSGSTQVNANDLNALPTPSRRKLTLLGTQWSSGLSQEEVDSICKMIC